MKAIIDALQYLMVANEGATISGKEARELRDAGLVRLCGCSDGDYIELTDKGRRALISKDGE